MGSTSKASPHAGAAVLIQRTPSLAGRPRRDSTVILSATIKPGRNPRRTARSGLESLPSWSPMSLETKSRGAALGDGAQVVDGSALDIPMPLSVMVSVLASLSRVRRILSSESPPYRLASLMASKRSLSQASDALEISSRRKISLLEYSEWVTRCRGVGPLRTGMRGFFLLMVI